MVSTFHGLETAKRALTASQSALYTTGHNISNANTQGYTRQRVDFRTTNPYNAPYGQIGTGVEPGQVIRIRETISMCNIVQNTINSDIIVPFLKHWPKWKISFMNLLIPGFKR